MTTTDHPRTPAAVAHEAPFVRAFVVSEKVERWEYLLTRPTSRRRILRALGHTSDLSRQWREELPAQHDSADDVVARLRALGAPGDAYLISEDPTLDGMTMGLGEAVRRLMDSVAGGILSSIPGRLAFFHGEAPKDRFILVRTSGPRRTEHS